MNESESEEFGWTFPLYILASNYTALPNGDISFTGDTSIVTPEMSGSIHLAVFTDSDTAERYRAVLDPSLNFRAFPFSPEQMLRFLRGVIQRFPNLVIDPHPQIRLSRTAKSTELIAGIERYLSGQGE